MNEIDKKRVLIVDDNPYILKILATMLKLENLEITTAKNGEDALHLIINETEGKFDIIVTDYQMPIINGQECRQGQGKEEKCMIVSGVDPLIWWMS